MNCSKCGSHLEPDDLFCGNCGQVVDLEEAGHHEVAQDPDRAPETIVQEQVNMVRELETPRPPLPPEPGPIPAAQESQVLPSNIQSAQPISRQPQTSPRVKTPWYRSWYWIGSIALILCTCLAIAAALGVFLFRDDIGLPSAPTEVSSFRQSATPRPTEEEIIIFPDSEDTQITPEPVIIELATEIVVEPDDNTLFAVTVEPAIARSVLSQALLDTGFIFIGVYPFDLWPMSVLEDDERFGFEIWLAEEIIWRMFGDEIEIEWVPVSAVDRFDMLESGALDMLVRSTAHTRSREEFGLFSTNYFLSGYRIAATADSGISDLGDLGGRKVAVLGGSFAEVVLFEQSISAGVDIIPVPFETLINACASLLDGEVDAMISDWMVLLNCTEGDPSYVMVTDLLASDNDGDGIRDAEPYGVVVPPGEGAFLAEVDAALLEIIEDGTWQLIYDIWFDEQPPWTLGQMLNAPPADR